MKKLTLLLLLSLSLALATPTLAQVDIPELEGHNQAFLREAGLGTQTTDISEIASDIIKFFLSFLGIIFIILIVYAGFMWMTSAGEEAKISKAKSTMVAAVIGLAIVLAAYAITYFVIDQILESTKGGQGLD